MSLTLRTCSLVVAPELYCEVVLAGKGGKLEYLGTFFPHVFYRLKQQTAPATVTVASFTYSNKSNIEPH